MTNANIINIKQNLNPAKYFGSKLLNSGKRKSLDVIVNETLKIIFY